ncbi:MAG: TIR domain-containing protein [Candidatus Lokiarchaeota archaeon]|nr:TIR domain-containing protein [Candidatus Harpocratesius repetitus]
MVIAKFNTHEKISNNQLFISYSHQDKNEAYLITNFLGGKNIRFWYDYVLKENPGIEWKKEIERNIRFSEIFIILLSEFSIKSSAVREEYRLAKKFERKIIPIILNEDLNAENINSTNNEEYSKIIKEHFPDIYKNQYIEKYRTGYDLIEFQSSLLAMVEKLTGVQIQESVGLVPIYNIQKTIIGFTTRPFLHFIPQAYHKTIIAILVAPVMQDKGIIDPTKRKIIVQVKPKKRKRRSGSLAFFGGHNEINESYTDTAIRELSEEINIPEEEITKQPLIRIGREGEFSWTAEDKEFSRYNYEFSTLYVYHLANRPYFFQETIGPKILPVFTIQITLDELFNIYNNSTTIGSFIKDNSIEIPENIQKNMGDFTDPLRFSDDIVRLFGYPENITQKNGQSFSEDLQKRREKYEKRWKAAIFDAIQNPHHLSNPDCKLIL